MPKEKNTPQTKNSIDLDLCMSTTRPSMVMCRSINMIQKAKRPNTLHLSCFGVREVCKAAGTRLVPGACPWGLQPHLFPQHCEKFEGISSHRQNHACSTFLQDLKTLFPLDQARDLSA